MDDNIRDALEYASGSSKLEDIKLTDEELHKIMLDIKTGRTDESFFWCIYQALCDKQQKIENDSKEVKPYRKNR